ncbi:NFACT family protein [Spirulina sp. 06S082]|uniref:Rqc2 family fibronectin-binding protein n=1 Tax=Spirulina sp. 06S082 TaxID=3110248 RepID=UPI002B1F808B|nr:NFACT family protein [Spirulina sp. 06S082]MEA5470437.1 NFACT family protein [Spirulina sp. 06S082]
MQPVDFTTLTAVCADLRSRWIPARVEQVYQRDVQTIFLALRTLHKKGWLTICWHPQAARICLGSAPPRDRDTFTFSDQLRHQLKGLALTAIAPIAPWERVIDLQFAQRPEDEPLWHLYVEVMGKYSNAILTDGGDRIVTVAHQVGAKQSRVRTVQTGQPYEFPPSLLGDIPSLEETQERWQERVSLVPGAIGKQLLKTYRGLSPTVVNLMIESANLTTERSTQDLSGEEWEKLFQSWQEWLQAIATGNFTPGWTKTGYTVLPWGLVKPEKDVQILLDIYYSNAWNRQQFQQLQHQILQKLKNVGKKLTHKAQGFRDRLAQSKDADKYRTHADLLMAYLHEWKPGMQSISLTDFETGQPVKIPLNPEKNAVQNAQILYKKHQKLKRAKDAIKPFLQEVETEIQYLEQVEAALSQLEHYKNVEDLPTLREIREELVQQGYFEAGKGSDRAVVKESQPYCYPTPSGFEVWIGRNNRQNDRLSFRIAGDYDLWFHAQEIAGSHVLLRLTPGAVAEDIDVQFAADFAAYYSRGRQSDRVPVVYTEPKFVYKPKGAKPGIAIYKREQVIWGRSHKAQEYLNEGK